MCDFNSIAELNNFIVLDKYTKIEQSDAGYQTEAALERELISDLAAQGYEHLRIRKSMLYIFLQHGRDKIDMDMFRIISAIEVFRWQKCT